MELVPDSWIVDHASTGVTWTYRTAPTDSGTTLSLGYAISTGVRLVDSVLDRVFRSQERQLDMMLASNKHAIEAQGEADSGR
jgi:nucleoside 2-deoxyribosyltransferase